MKKKEAVILFEFGLPDTTIKIKGEEVNLKGKNFDIILSVIAVYSIYKDPNKNGYVEISSTVFKEKLGNYKPYITYLLSQGMIENDYFIYVNANRVSSQFLYDKNQTSKCYGYRFSWEFANSVNVIKTIYYQQTVNTKEKKYQAKPVKSIQEIPNYINPETLKRLKRDFHSAKIVSLIPMKTNMEGSKYLDMGKWFDNILRLHKWKNVSSFFHFSTNRLYSNFTSLSSHVRKNNITLSNQSLEDLDIHNSFPLMIAVYCLQQDPQIINDPDFIRYCELVKSGTFYEEMEKLLNMSLDCDTNIREIKYAKKVKQAIKLFEKEGIKTKLIDNRDTHKRKLTRNIVKELFQIYLNNDLKRSPMVKGYGDSFIKVQMKNYFGCVHEQITSIKEQDNMVYHKIVEIETRFVFDIIEELYESYPEIRILTCHDSISFSSNFQNEVQEIWDKHMNRLFNSLPGEISDNNEEDLNEYCFEEVFQMEDTTEIQTPSKSKFIYSYTAEDFEFEEDDIDFEDNDDSFGFVEIE